jgi:hypothetical protein
MPTSSIATYSAMTPLNQIARDPLAHELAAAAGAAQGPAWCRAPVPAALRPPPVAPAALGNRLQLRIGHNAFAACG